MSNAWNRAPSAMLIGFYSPISMTMDFSPSTISKSWNFLSTSVRPRFHEHLRMLERAGGSYYLPEDDGSKAGPVCL